MMGNLTPFVVNGPPTTNTVTTTFTQDLTIGAKATPTLTLSSTTTTIGTLVSTSVTDTGSNPITAFVSRIGASTAATTRPTHGWYDASNLILSLLPLNSGANGALSWGTQAVSVPTTFASRPNGLRQILYSSWNGSTLMDYGIGVDHNTGNLWSVGPAATSSYAFRMYFGITPQYIFRGDGATFFAGTLNITSAGTTNYSRLGQKLETNTSANYGGAALNTWSATSAERSLFDFNRSKSATIGTQAIVASGDSLGTITGRGSDGTAFIPAASIEFNSDGTPGTNDMPGRLSLWTTADGAASPTERMRITNAGDVGIGKTPTTGIILDVNGQLGLKSYTVATLPSASVQAGAIVYASDAGGNGPCLVISNGTNWKRCDNTSTTVS